MRRYSPPDYSPPRRGYGGGGGGGGGGARSPPRRGYEGGGPRSPIRRGYGGGGPRSPPRRGYEGGGGPRSPPRRGYNGGGGGGHGRRKDQNGSLLVRNIPLDCRAEELRVPFERFGPVRDVYLPKDYYTGEPRGFAFVQFVDSHDASDAQYHMNGQIFAGRQISVVLAAETRKGPDEMRQRSGVRGPSSGHSGRRSSHHDRSRSRSVSRSPRHPSGSRSRYRSRSFSPPAPRRQGHYSDSPSRRPVESSRSPRGPPQERDDGDHNHGRYGAPADHIENGNGFSEKTIYESKEGRAQWRASPGRASRSPPGSRSRSADPSPRQGRLS